MTKAIALYDLSLIFNRWWHATANSEMSEAKHKTVSQISSTAGDYDLVAICCDRPPYARKDLMPEYKGNREKPSQAMIGQMVATKDELEGWGYKLVGVKGWEADDVIATLAKQASGKGWSVDIYSSDKDVKQCLYWSKARTIDPLTGEIHKGTDILISDKFGVPPDKIPDMLALVGDSSDNIPGLNKVGPKTAAKWIRHFGGLDGLLAGYQSADSPLTPRQKSLIAEAGTLQRLVTARELITLRTDLEIDLRQLQEPQSPRSGQAEISEDDYPEAMGDAEPIADQPPPSPPPQTPQILPKQTAIARSKVNGESRWELALEPSNFTEAWEMANGLHKSGLFIHSYDGPHKILTVILTGRARGLDAVTSLRGFNVIKNRVSPSASLLVGLIKNHPSCEYFYCSETEPDKATWVTKRKGEPKESSLTFTLQEAETAGYTAVRDPKRPGNWQKIPKTMCRWRAATELARMVYPDVTAGLYTIDEVEDFA